MAEGEKVLGCPITDSMNREFCMCPEGTRTPNLARMFVYRFDWDVSKAMANWHKHGVSFKMATTVFRDRRALSRYDAAHSQHEERWITLGLVETGQVVVLLDLDSAGQVFAFGDDERDAAGGSADDGHQVRAVAVPPG